MLLLGEILAICASVIWTVSSMTAEVSSKRIGAVPSNTIAMFIAFLWLNITLFVFTGLPFPQHLNTEALLWIAGSGLFGYIICNYFLYTCYILIGSRFGELFMTLSIPSAAFAGWILLDEKLTFQELIGITVTLTGIIISILSGDKSEQNKENGTPKGHKIKLNLSPKGIFFAIIASIAQGVGLVFGKVGMIHYHESIPEELTKLNAFIPISSSYIRIAVGLCGFLLIALFTHKFPIIKKAFKEKKGAIPAMITGTVGPFMGATCALFAMRYAKAGIAATLLELTPIIIILPAYWIFKQKIRAIEIIGAIISVFGVSLFFIKF